MNEKIINFINTSKKFLGKHSPEILTGIGITGMLTTTILAVKGTPKALELIQNKKDELQTDELSIVDTIKVAWKPYLPAIGVCIPSIACLIGASTINYKRNAALATAYAISERTLIRYRDKVVETLGERKEKQIHEKIAQDEIDKDKVSNSQVIITSKGNTLCRDSLSGRYFKCDIDTIKRAVNKLNRDLTYQHYISLNEFYYEIGLDGTKNGDLIGWNLDRGLIEPIFSTCLADNDEPCIVIDFTVCPAHDYDKLF